MVAKTFASPCTCYISLQTLPTSPMPEVRVSSILPSLGIGYERDIALSVFPILYMHSWQCKASPLSPRDAAFCSGPRCPLMVISAHHRLTCGSDQTAVPEIWNPL